MTIKRIPRLPVNRVKTLWSKVRMQPNGCWEWQAGGNHGYGSIILFGTPYQVHRVVYKAYYLIDPGDLLVLHKCDNPPCCNPLHLFLGTTADNVRDRCEKGRSGEMSNRSPEIYARGERQGSAKMTPDKVRELRRRSANGESGRSLGRTFGISQASARRIIERLNWKHIK